MKLWIAAAAVLALCGSLSAQAPTATVPHHAADGTRQIDEVTFTIGDLKREPGYQPRYASHPLRLAVRPTARKAG